MRLDPEKNEYWPIFGSWIEEGLLQSPVGKFFYKQYLHLCQQKLKIQISQEKMFYEDDSPLYEILWWSRLFLISFGFNFASIFVNVGIFLYVYIMKNLKSIYLNNKK